LQIIFPKPVRRIRANPDYLETASKKGKALIGRFTGKHVAGAPGGAVATIAIPKAAGLKDWGDVFDELKVLCSFERVHQIGSGAVAIGGGRFSAAESARHVNRGIGYRYKAGGRRCRRS
jgi:hypothetical protein